MTNNGPDQDRTEDSALVKCLQSHFDRASDAVVVKADIADVHRRLRRRTGFRRSVGSAAAVAAVIVGAIVVWPSDSEQQVAVTGPEASEDSGTVHNAEDVIVDTSFAGDRPDIVTAVDRTTADGLRLQALVLDRFKNPTNTLPADIPRRCIDPEEFDLVVQLPYSGYGSTNAVLPLLTPGDVFITRGYLQSFERQLKLPNGSVDPRTVVEPLPGAQPDELGVTDPFSYYVAVRGDSSFVKLRVSYPDGQSDEATSVNGLAVVGNRTQADPNNPMLVLMPPATFELTFADGHVLTVDDSSTNYPLTPDGHPRLSAATNAANTGDCNPIAAALPAAGEGPKDEASARAAVLAAVETAANGALPIAERLPAFLDPDRGQRIVDELGEANIAGTSNSSGTVTGLVFISPTEAVIKFDLVLPPEVEGNQIPPGYMIGNYGKVVLKDGRWLLTSESICKLVHSVTPKACEGLNTTYYPKEIYAVDE